MSLPRPPISANTPIPNQPFSADEVYYLESNQGRLPLGNGLFIDPVTGDFTDIAPTPYIYCTPQFSELPVTYPPYNCEIEVNTAGVTDFEDAWYECDTITEFPCIDTSSGTTFRSAWGYCYNMETFPTLNLSGGVANGFEYAWLGCESLTEFPLLDLRNGVNFNDAWNGCSSLTSFPALNLESGEIFTYSWYNCTGLTSFPSLINISNGTDFSSAWQNCTNLATFPAGVFDSCLATNFANAWTNCALDQASVNNILVSINTAGTSNGNLGINGGTSAAPSAAGLAAKVSLQGRGWTVLTN